MARKQYKDDQLLSPKFKLPPIGGRIELPWVIASRAFTWKLQPYVNGENRFIHCKCSLCDNNSDRKKAIERRNMSFHFESSHPSAYKKLIEKFPIQNSVKKENVNEAPHLASKKSNTKAVTVDSILSNSLQKDPSIMTLDEATHTVVDPVPYKTLFLAYLTANNLPFAHSDSPASAALLAYAKNCQLDEPPIINHHSMTTALNIVYRDSVKDIKDKLPKHKGKFALTLDEWKSGSISTFSS